MSKVQVLSQVELDTDELLKGVARLEPEELDRFVRQVLAISAYRHTPSLSKTESELLQQINEGVPVEVRNHYERLHQKMLDEALTDDEQTELIALSDQIEQADAERLQQLIHLAQIRQVPVERLMNDLNLRRRVYA